MIAMSKREWAIALILGCVLIAFGLSPTEFNLPALITSLIGGAMVGRSSAALMT